MEIEKLAKLARINLSSEEKEKIQKEFEAILGYISMLKEANTDKTAISNKTETTNILRKDENKSERKTEPKSLVEMAPFMEGGYVKVKHVFE